MNASTEDHGLDDVMIAMDVVDTLRHDQRIVDRELNDEGRRGELIERLREIYRSQGIEVPDTVLEEGVKALEEDRFVYDPPKNSWATFFARLYVTRGDWLRYVAYALLALTAMWLIWYFVVENPRANREEYQRTELNQRIPESLNRMMNEIRSETSKTGLIQLAEKLYQDGLNAATSQELNLATEKEKALKAYLDNLRREYEVRIVVETGQQSGIWRVPDVNQRTRNYYLIVEAVDRDGTVIPQNITNEESGSQELVRKWGVRVPRSVFDSVREDKQDDGIIQNRTLAQKSRGEDLSLIHISEPTRLQ